MIRTTVGFGIAVASPLALLGLLAPTATASPEPAPAVDESSLFFAPPLLLFPGPLVGQGRGAAAGPGPALMAPLAVDNPAPTSAFLGLFGPGGLLIGDGLDGGPGQDGGPGGLLWGNGGHGGDGAPGQRGGNGATGPTGVNPSWDGTSKAADGQPGADIASGLPPLFFGSGLRRKTGNLAIPGPPAKPETTEATAVTAA